MLSSFFWIPLFVIMALNLPVRAFRKMAFWLAMLLFIIQISLAAFHHSYLLGHAVELKGNVFNMSFAVDHLTIIVLLSIGIVSLATLVVARCMIEDEAKLFNFINLLITASIGMNGIAMVKDIFSLYVFLEITAVSAFIMITINKDKNALEGAFKYIMLSAIATIMMLSSIALLMLVSTDTSFAAIKAGLASSRSNPLMLMAIGIFICGLLIKGGIVPFHGWLPDAYSAASAPASVLLAGIVTKVSGIYTLMRVVVGLFGFSAPVTNTLMLVGTLSIVVGALAALGQNNFKRMLAYSSISQVGYIILGFGTGTALGIAGAAFHLFNHAIFKSLLFVNSAAVEKEAGTVDMDKLGGLAKCMPVTGATSVVALLSTCGIPPLAGFWSKLVIIVALWKEAHYAYAAIAILAGVLTLAYLLTMQRKVFFGKLAAGLEHVREAHPSMVVISIILALITVGVGVFYSPIFNYFILPVQSILTQ